MAGNSMVVNGIVDQILSFYIEGKEQIYFGENITQTQHAFQSAVLAKNANADDETILAAFLHDIGHLCFMHEDVQKMDNYGVMDHEELGSSYLREMGFSKKICDLIAAHVKAKRYLAYAEPDYYNNLSDASKKTLVFQGGKMDDEEAGTFENQDLFPLFIAMRKWDEKAKSIEPVPEDFEFIKTLMISHLNHKN